MPNAPNHDDRLSDITHWPYHIKPVKQLALSMMAGDPVPAPRPVFNSVTRRAINPSGYRVYRNNLGWALKQGWMEWGRELDSKTAFGLRAFFYRATRHRTDVDNLLKTCHDAGTGVIWQDDSQVVETFGRVFFGSSDPRVIILVYEADTPAFETPYTCHWCKKAFYTSRSLYNLSPPVQGRKRHYCSWECKAADWTAARVTHTCPECERQFTVPASLKGLRFCSRECMQAYHAKRSPKTPKPNASCEVCGQPVSRTSYKRCMGCHLASITAAPKSQYRHVIIL